MTKSKRENSEDKTIRSADLLIEFGCEELPPKSLPALANNMFELFSAQLLNADLGFNSKNSRVLYSPRRIALLMSGVASKQPDQTLERKGPALSAAFDADQNPTPAAIGFARSVGKDIADLETLKTDNGEWLYCRVEKTGQPLDNLLLPMLEKTLGMLAIAKPMRWASNDFSFIRPLHWLLVLHGTKVVDVTLMGHRASNTTRGHRVHSPGPHLVKSPQDYESLLEAASVLVDHDKRREIIQRQATELGVEAGGRALIDPNLLDEVSNLVEWPRSICGSFDPEFLDIPAEALIASMQDHQKFFPVLEPENSGLLARFITVINLESRDPDAVRQGFERVIRPRLADARFFWDLDHKAAIKDWLPSLDKIVFQKSLGSIGDKSRRIADISLKIAEYTGVDKESAERAALLCKCDLASQMVGEFPELQGVMGRYYADSSGESSVVAQAIGEHYLPAYSGDRLPGHPVGKIVSLADRLDSLTGIFATGLKPSGNKDPFALRRAALGLVRILLDGELNIELDKLLAIAAMAVQQQLAVSPEVLLELRQFIIERLKHYLRDQGYETSLINSALDAPLTTLPDLVSRLAALREFIKLPAAAILVAANKRIGNILRKSGFDKGSKINEDILLIAEERLLFDEIKNISSDIDQLCRQADYSSALTLLAGLSDNVAAFFDHVMVMDENADIRVNRLSILAGLKELFDRIANLALIG